MTPPLNDIITPTGKRIAAQPDKAVNTVESYLSQLEHIEALAAKSAESRRAYLTAAYAGETK